VRDINKHETLPYLLNAFTAQSVSNSGQLQTTLYKTITSGPPVAIYATPVDVTNIGKRKRSQFHKRDGSAD
jgi:hypothetical protein